MEKPRVTNGLCANESGKSSDSLLKWNPRASQRDRALAALACSELERGELISKALVGKQAAFLLISLRQRILAAPDRLARQFMNIADVNNVRTILKQAMLALLTELADLPSKVTNPHWLDEVAAEETEAEGGK